MPAVSQGDSFRQAGETPGLKDNSAGRAYGPGAVGAQAWQAAAHAPLSWLLCSSTDSVPLGSAQEGGMVPVKLLPACSTHRGACS